jgi:RimJ/RimL family protein N-acetyltransferase
VAVIGDLDLLRLEIATLWESDARGRLTVTREPEARRALDVVVATCVDGRLVAFSDRVPERLAQELRAAIDRAPPENDPAVAPRWLERCERLLREAAGAPISVSCGPSYVVEPDAVFPAPVETRGWRDPGGRDLAGRNPPEANWPADEWAQLIRGDLGPWAMALDGEDVVAICHCARLTDEAAEAGVWTHPAHRRQGFAAAVTAAWARLASEGGRRLFYSTSADNRSSQRVAERLGLRQIGWTWKLDCGEDAFGSLEGISGRR